MSIGQEHRAHIDWTALRAVGVAVIATFFFSLTFVLNRCIVVGGGHWAWAVTLRYLITFFILGTVVICRDGLGGMPKELQRHWREWLIWSVVGFGVFGTCLTWAAASGPAWLVAGGFQFTVIAGPLLAPLIYRDERGRLAIGTLSVGILIIVGVFAMQYGSARQTSLSSALLPAIAVLAAACTYPLGNRKILLHLERCGCSLTATQRVFGMTLMSLALYLPLAGMTWAKVGPPSWRETGLAGGVALSSGVIATVLFFGATEVVRRNRAGLAAVECTTRDRTSTGPDRI
jgi:drug/metabolite transporter (DMT)-like permease